MRQTSAKNNNNIKANQIAKDKKVYNKAQKGHGSTKNFNMVRVWHRIQGKINYKRTAKRFFLVSNERVAALIRKVPYANRLRSIEYFGVVFGFGSFGCSQLQLQLESFRAQLTDLLSSSARTHKRISNAAGKFKFTGRPHGVCAMCLASCSRVGKS